MINNVRRGCTPWLRAKRLRSQPVAHRQYLDRTAFDQCVEQRSPDSLPTVHRRDDELPGRDGAILPLGVADHLPVPLGDQMLDPAVATAEV